MEDKPMVYYVPPIRGFKDTGYVTHSFKNGSSITSRVVPSGDFGGFAIEIVAKDGNETDDSEAIRFTLDRFAALCLAHAIIKNLMDQEELNEYNYQNQFTVGRMSNTGGVNSESGGMGEGKESA